MIERNYKIISKYIKNLDFSFVLFKKYIQF